jgi:hypothetical protein
VKYSNRRQPIREPRDNPRATCPDCKRPNVRTTYQIQHNYVCDRCANAADWSAEN